MTPLRLFRRTKQIAVFALIICSLAAVGCAVDQEQLDRWRKTEEGPRRLSAVVLFQKYPIELRVRAAQSLIEMKPRKGQRVGLDRLVHGTLICDPTFVTAGGAEEPCRRVQLGAETRAQILQQLVPIIIAELGKPVPKATQGGQATPDPSFKYKDAAYMMMTYDKQEIITNQALKKQLKDALTKWAMADFERKLNDRSQAYGMEQLLRLIGSESVAGLPPLMTKENRNLGKIASLVAKLGTKTTKDTAGRKLVTIMKYVSSAKWRKDKEPGLKEANRKAKLEPTKKQLQAQMADYQREAGARVFVSMKKVGGSAVVKYCLGLASDKKQSTKRRRQSLAAIEGHIDNKSKSQIDTLLRIAKSDAPNLVLDQAFRRIRELPREKTAPQLYDLFKTKKWKLRRAAAATILAMSTAKHVDEFIDNLSRLARENFNLAEVLTYGALLGGLKDGDAKKALLKHTNKGNVRGRLTALSYYFEYGTKKDLKALAPFERAGQRIPKCDEDGECDWSCVVGSGKKRVTKDVKTLGDFVKYCIVPKATSNVPKDEKKKKEKHVGEKTDSKTGKAKSK